MLTARWFDDYFHWKKKRKQPSPLALVQFQNLEQRMSELEGTFHKVQSLHFTDGTTEI